MDQVSVYSEVTQNSKINWPARTTKVKNWLRYSYEDLKKNGKYFRFRKIRDEFRQYEYVAKNSKYLLEPQADQYVLFQPIIQLPSEIENFYSVAWDVKQIEEILHQERYEIDQEEIPYEKINMDVQTNLVERDDPSNGVPIVAYYEPFDLYIPLCPLTRIKRKRTEHVRVSIIPPKLHLKAMLGEQCRLFYKIHHNLSVLERYCKGQIKRIDYCERYPEHYIYNLFQTKVKIKMQVSYSDERYTTEILGTLLQPVTDRDFTGSLAQAFHNIRQRIPIVSAVELVGDVPDSFPKYVEIE